jgi:hypothetical protein
MASEDTTTTSTTTSPTSTKLTSTLDQLLGGIKAEWKDGADVFGKLNYVAPSGATKNAWDMSLDAANQPWYMKGLKTASDNATDLLKGGGTTAGQRTAMGAIGDVGSGFGDIAASAGNPSLTEHTLLDTARGKYLNEEDPNYRTMIDRVANETSGDIAASMGYDGNFGSNVHGEMVADQIGGLRTNAAVAERNANLQRQTDALSAIEGTRNTSMQNLIAALSGQGGAASTAFGMEQGGINNMSDMSALLPQLLSAGQLPATITSAVGGAKDADALAKRLAEGKLFDDKANANTDLLARLSAILGGTAGAAGTTTTSTQPSTPLWQTLAGLALGGLSLA